MKVISFRDIDEGGITELYTDVKTLVSHNPGLKYYTIYGEKEVTEEWVESELDANAVASVHKTEQMELMGITFGKRTISYVISEWAVID